MKKRTLSYLAVILGSGLIVMLVGGGIPSSIIASAASKSKLATISGTLSECPPDPSWGRDTPSPAMVVLLRNGITYNSQSIAFPKSALWSGHFRFSVQPGTYQVVSSYQGRAQTVTAKAGHIYKVSFGKIGCAE